MNAALPWLQWFHDSSGRVVGGGENDCVHGWDDERVVSFIERFPVAGKRILEPGCLEGVMTCALCHAGAVVTAFDCRAACAAKTYTRCAAFGFSPRVLIHDAREMDRVAARCPEKQYDAIFHSGVLYHLPEPAAHLRALRKLAPFVGLHTHTCDSAATEHEGYDGRWRDENGWSDHFSGAQERSFHPTREALQRMIADAGWTCETVWERPAPSESRVGWYFLEALC
ncbi:MAG: class I SAM-dependent methyltransferase [Pirellulales bacterium]